MDAIETVKQELAPLLDRLLLLLQEENNDTGCMFFENVAANLANAQAEEDLIILFIEHLSASAFIVHQSPFQPAALAVLDELLQKAESLALTFSVSAENVN
ncbi:MAG: hypothetical protein AAF512_00810 [Pseudomonadota bacterium]